MPSWLCIGVALVRSSTGPPNSARAFVRWNADWEPTSSVNLDAPIDLFQRSARRSSWACWSVKRTTGFLMRSWSPSHITEHPRPLGLRHGFATMLTQRCGLGSFLLRWGMEPKDARRSHRTDERRRCPGAGLGLCTRDTIDFIRNKDFATVSVAACGSEHEDCVIHKPLPWPNPRLRLWCSVRHLSQCGSVSRRRGHARH